MRLLDGRFGGRHRWVSAGQLRPLSTGRRSLCRSLEIEAADPSCPWFAPTARPGSTIASGVQGASMSDRRSWLQVPCPTYRAAAGARCCVWRWSSPRSAVRSTPLPRLDVARGWRERVCPTCRAWEGEDCQTPPGRPASHIHAARLRPGRRELVSRDGVWGELERRGTCVAVVPFCGRAGRDAETGPIRLWRLDGDELAELAGWTGRDELSNALEAPVWDRYGTFAGQAAIRAEVIWTLEGRSVVIVGRRGGRRFREAVR